VFRGPTGNSGQPTSGFGTAGESDTPESLIDEKSVVEANRVLDCLKEGKKSYKTCVGGETKTPKYYTNPSLYTLSKCLKGPSSAEASSAEDCLPNVRSEEQMGSEPMDQVQKVLVFGKTLLEHKGGSLLLPLNMRNDADLRKARDYALASIGMLGLTSA
jgi:hypothetical protein